MHPLEGCFEKLDRAASHLESFNTAARTWVAEGDPYALPVDIDYETRERVVKFKILRELPGLCWGVIIGDFAHNLRSALDQLVWRLVEMEGNADPRDLRTAFPIVLSIDQWKEKVVGPRRSKRYAPHGKGPLAGLDESGKAWTAIKACQPFVRYPPDPSLDFFAGLEWLWNEDKHRVVAAAYATIGAEKLVFTPYWDAHVAAWNIEDGPFENNGAEVARLTLTGDVSLNNPQVQVDGNLAFRVAFGERPGVGKGISNVDLPQMLLAVYAAFGDICSTVGLQPPRRLAVRPPRR